MKYILLVVFTCVCITATTQPQFEGKVHYDVVSKEISGNGQLTIFFSKPGIRIEATPKFKEDRSPEIMIINLDSGKMFTLNADEKSYKETILKKKIQSSASQKIIAGFKTNPVTIESIGMSRDFAAIFESSILYPAEELSYNVPYVYSSNPELIMINKGKIVLGGDFYFPDYPDYHRDLSDSATSENRKLFAVNALQVSKESVDASLFIVPPEYSKQKPYDYSGDSMSALADTLAYPVDSITPQQKTPPKKKKSPTKKKSSTKQQAIRRKDD